MSSLLRSTKFVRYFTGAARTLILNAAKTAEVNSLNNSKALCASNSVLLRDYTTNKQEKLEPLLQKLDSEVRKFGRITKKDIDEVFDEIKVKNDITSSQSLLVIRCCGELVPEELPEQRTLLVQKIWNVLTEKGIPMDISHYNALLRVYLENEHPFSPAQFLEELEKKGLQPNRVTYQRLMWRYCQEGDVEGATKVLEKMRELNFPVSEPVLNALVMGHAFHGDAEGAKAVLETMSAAGLKPTNRTYTLLACGYAKQGDMANIENIIKIASENDAFLADKDILEVIEHLTLSGHSDKVEQLFTHLQKGFGYNQEVCSLIMRLINKGHINTAKVMLKTMPKSPNANETLFKGAFFVKQLIKSNKPAESIVQICKEITEEGLVPNAIYIATECSLQQGNADLALKLFGELKNQGYQIRHHYYWPLLIRKGKDGDEEGLLQVIRSMNSEGIVVNGETLREYIIPYFIKKDTPENVIIKLQIANVPIVQCARNVMFDLLGDGKIKKAADIALRFQPRGHFGLLSSPLLSALNKTKDIKSFVNILHVLNSTANNSTEDDSNEDQQKEYNSSNEIGGLVRSAVKILGTVDKVQILLTELLSKGLRISTTSAEAIQDILSKNMTSEISDLLTKLTANDLVAIPVANMPRIDLATQSSASLENLLNKIKSSDGESKANRIQKLLLNAYINENNVDKLDKHIQELKASNFELSLAVLGQIFECYAQNDAIDKALEIEKEIRAKNPGYVFSTYKAILMANSLVRANRYDDALKFLSENKPNGELNISFQANSKAWQMLNYLAEQKDDAKVLEMTNKLIENKFVEPSNILLGPSIKVFLVKGDLDSALKQFEHCCNKYRSTPWKGELMKTLIMKEDATKLQWLADLGTQIHGEVNILHDLVLAFIECGRLRQARRILETPGLHTRQARLDSACQRYVEEGKPEYLESLLEATKELSHIDRSNIFYHLLISYCKANETDKALGLWTLLQEEGEVPSKEFLIYLGNHLKANNREIPFVMPDEPVKKVQKTVKTDDALTKIITPKKLEKPTRTSVSSTIENLVKSGNPSEAMNYAIKSIQDGVMPKFTVMKFLLKNLAEEGNVEKIQLLGKYINEKVKKDVTYDDKLTLAIFKRGAGRQHIESLFEAVKAAKTPEDMSLALKKFPRSNALASVINDRELLTKCVEISDIAASQGQLLPANLIWIEYLLSGKDKEAQEIWNKYLSNSELVIFRRVLQESYVRNQPEIIEKLVNILKTNKSLSPASLGNAYSRLINTYVLSNNVEKGSQALDDAIQSGVDLTRINKSTLKRLKLAVESTGGDFQYSI